MRKYKVRCYESSNLEKVVGLVPYVSNLDHWDGHNWNCGQRGRHLGVGRTKKGKYYLCHGTQWEGERDYAKIVTKSEAQEAVLEHNPDIWEELFPDEPLPKL